ncbi:RWD domain-containing protein 2A [Onthophagus taurus]|uniref:RWD domain-containing protein 2A n=1 Tax=Onthophagus taurus TaxID=166361 RepID=UPI000C2076E2|nr:RWD domain-containing protein 2A [Onthophagus taurus]XP_022920183.1 RWD domain-containing protein 2A [Onthophagus taurus]
MESLKANLDAQISEMEMLQSMFNPGELKIEDPKALEEIKQFLNDPTDKTPPFIDFTINLEIATNKYELCINLPHEYPEIEPDVFVRNNKINRILHTKLNKDLNEYLSKCVGEPCIFNAVSWLQEEGLNYFEEEEKVEEKEIKIREDKLIRYWIYSHHIYSKTKRKEILNLANDLGITGFCMAGKPGVICVEGFKGDCDEWWSRIKSMNWKRIFCKVTEDAKSKKFNNFEEVSFTNHGMRANHMDMGEFYKYLERYQCAYIFKDLFGVDKNEQ